MCGIFGYIGQKQNAGDMVLEGLKTLEYRGYDSWGVAVKKDDNSVYIEKHTGKIGHAHLPRLSATIGIGHTRWATHGGVTDANAHPHTDCTGKVVIVHNGIVENFAVLKEDLLKKGHTFKSETDTEVVVHLIEELKKTETDLKKLMLKVFETVHGMNAIIAFFPEEEEMYIVKNGSPIAFGVKNGEYFIASDPSAMIIHTKEVYFLEDDELLQLSKNDAKLFTIDGKEKAIKYTTLAYDIEDALLGNYPHFMLKEMHEQPKVVQNIADTQHKNIQECAKLIKDAFGTYFIGCGTAGYAGLAGTYLFSKIAKRHVNTTVASEFPYLIDFLKEDSLIVALSQSGETIDLISTIKKAKEKGTKVVTLTNVLGSTLYRISDYKLLLQAGPEKGVASTKAYIAKITLLYLLAHEIAGTFDEGLEHIKKAVTTMKNILKKENDFRILAEKLKNANNMFVIGRGVSYAAALEASLKIKEVSYIHAEGLAGGELKHGPIALIEKGTPVIIFNPADETYEDSLSSAHEVKARGAYVIGISSKPNPVYDEFIQVEDCDDATIIPNVVISQLLGYFLAVVKNLDPDKPRNLAKSVTVK